MRRFWLFFQNFAKEEKPDKKYYWHGRASLHDRKTGASIGVEWQAPTRHAMWTFYLADHEWAWAFGCRLFAIWIHADDVPWIRRGAARELSLSAHDHALWWLLWQDPHEWRSTDPKWRRGVIHFFQPLED